ncbi:MAG: nucleotidyltransferase domain-containing protein [Nocardioidaceae bacterium]
MSDECAQGYASDLEPEELDFQRLYGPWAAFDPAEAMEFFNRTGITWWVAGGWAIQAFTGVGREHEDIDVCIFRRDLPLLRQAVGDAWHLWSAGAGMLRPVSEQFPEPHEESDQVWLRRHALAPWRADVPLNPDRAGDWVSRRDPDFSAPLEEVTFAMDGVRYLKPEIVLAFKAKLARPKDEQDFAVAAPMLDDRARGWLADYLRRVEPGHPWSQRL